MSHSPWHKAPAAGGRGRFFGTLFGPRCLCQNSLAGGAMVRDAGPLLEPPVPPLVRMRAAPGPWCGASVGTTGSAPCALACSRIYPGFMTDLFASESVPGGAAKVLWKMCTKWKPDLCRIYVGFIRLFSCSRRSGEKKEWNKSDSPLGPGT